MKRHLILSPLLLLLPVGLPYLESFLHLTVGLWLTEGRFRPTSEAWERLQSTPWLLFTQRGLFFLLKTWILFHLDLKDASNPSIITTQRNAFVRWIINKYPSSLHLQFNYAHNQFDTKIKSDYIQQPFQFNFYLMNNACYVAQLAYLYTRPRLFSLHQVSIDNKGLIISLNSKPSYRACLLHS